MSRILYLTLATITAACCLDHLPGQVKKSEQAKAISHNHIKMFGQPRRGHVEGVHGVDYTADGTKALSCSDDGTIKLWTSNTGKHIRTLLGHKGGVWRAFFYEGGKKIVSVGMDQTVRFFDAAKGTALGKISVLQKTLGNPLLMRLVAEITPDGKELYFPDVDAQPRDKMTRIDLTSMKMLPPLVIEGKKDIRHFSFSADGKHIVLAQVMKMVEGHYSLYDRATKKVVYTEACQRASRVCFHADNKKWLMVGPKGIETRLTADGKVEKGLRGIADTATGFAMTPDGSRAYMGFFMDSVVLCVDIATEKMAFRFGQFTDSVNALALSPDGKTLLAGGTDGALRFLDAADGKELFLPKWHQNRAQNVAVSADGKHVVSGTFDDEVVIWDGATGEPKHKLHHHKYSVIGSGFLPDGHAVSASQDNKIAILDPATGKADRTLEPDKSVRGMRAFTMSADGARAATGHSNNKVLVWDMAAGTIQHRISIGEDAPSALALGPSHVAVAVEGVVYVFKFGEDQPLATIPMIEKKKGEYSDERAVTALVMLSGDRLVMGHGNGRIRVFKVGTDKPERDIELKKESGYVASLRTSPDGKVLFAATQGAVHSLDTTTFAPVRKVIEAFDSAVLETTVGSQGRYLFTAMSDGTLLRLDLGKWK